MSKVADQLRLLAPCINRNIVECKSGIYIDVPRGCCVLIETLWNVNVLARLVRRSHLPY